MAEKEEDEEEKGIKIGSKGKGESVKRASQEN